MWKVIPQLSKETYVEVKPVSVYPHENKETNVVTFRRLKSMYLVIHFNHSQALNPECYWKLTYECKTGKVNLTAPKRPVAAKLNQPPSYEQTMYSGSKTSSGQMTPDRMITEMVNKQFPKEFAEELMVKFLTELAALQKAA